MFDDRRIAAPRFLSPNDLYKLRLQENDLIYKLPEPVKTVKSEYMRIFSPDGRQ